MSDELSLALEHHQSGRLDEAAQAYRSILAKCPEHADALHLLGVVALQQGDARQAVALILRAIVFNPAEAAYYCNLAEAYRNAGQLDRAIASCQVALRLQPDYPEAANNLGLAHLARGDAAAAIERFEAALRLGPLPMVHNNLGNARRLQGERAEALHQFQQAVTLDPSLAEAHSNLGQLLLEENQRQEALRHCREAVRLRPDFPEALANLGNVLRDLGHFAEARQQYAEALRLQPDLPLVYGNMGQALQEEGDLTGAIGWYLQGLQRDPTSAALHSHLASALEEQGKHDEAIGRFRLALQFSPNHAEAHHGLGVAFYENDQLTEARDCFEAALRLKPDFASAHCQLGTVHEELGQLEAARASFQASLLADPDHAGALSQLATMLRGKLPEEHQNAIRRLLARPQLGPGKRSALHFGLAHVLDGNGAYDEAAEHLRKGNSLAKALWQRQGHGYDPAGHAAFVDQVIATFTPEFFGRVRSFGLETERPVFIVGLPRSGTTLTEQVLASHSRAHGAGELPMARLAFEGLPRFAGTDGTSFDRLHDADGVGLRRAADWHLEQLSQRNAVADRVVDKMPENYLYLGMIVAMFPRAKIIHCRRDLRDIAVSCWMTNFRTQRWAVDADHIAERFREYGRLMEHWSRCLPVPLLEVQYEETVADLEGVARRLLAWCDLDWEPGCLAFHKTARPVRTASVAQVREPIYTRSVARWRNYEQALGSLFAKLPG
jgi:tetratricopeptide (TPR) repeat protein